MKNVKQKRKSEYPLKRAFILLAVRLLFFSLLFSIFLLCTLYIPQNITYEYRAQSKSSDLTPLSPLAPSVMQDADTESSRRSENSEICEKADNSLRILKIDESTDRDIGIFLTDGTLEGVLPASDYLTDYDLALLREGISVSKAELSQLIEEAEALRPY